MYNNMDSKSDNQVFIRKCNLRLKSNGNEMENWGSKNPRWDSNPTSPLTVTLSVGIGCQLSNKHCQQHREHGKPWLCEAPSEMQHREWNIHSPLLSLSTLYPSPPKLQKNQGKLQPLRILYQKVRGCERGVRMEAGTGPGWWEACVCCLAT